MAVPIFTHGALLAANIARVARKGYLVSRVYATGAARKTAQKAATSASADLARVGVDTAAKQAVRHVQKHGAAQSAKDAAKYGFTKMKEAAPQAAIETGVTFGLVEVQERLVEVQESADPDEVGLRSIVTGAIKGSIIGGLVAGRAGQMSGLYRGAATGAIVGAIAGATRGAVVGTAAAGIREYYGKARGYFDARNGYLEIVDIGLAVAGAIDAQDPMAEVDPRARLRAKAFKYLEDEWRDLEPYSYVQSRHVLYEKFSTEVSGGDKLGIDEFSMVYIIVANRKDLTVTQPSWVDVASFNRLIGGTI